VREMRHLDGSSQESEVGVELDDPGRIVVDGKFRTTATGVYAAGDVIGPGCSGIPAGQRRPKSRTHNP
jgi:pyruvate/2-oxoglutarate dehydrogenase complex dihydrolipoamide dehydrogenase (E3) component